MMLFSKLLVYELKKINTLIKFQVFLHLWVMLILFSYTPENN